MFKYKISIEKAPPKTRPVKPVKPAKIRKSWSKRKKLLVTLAVLAFLLGVAYYFLSKSLTGPAIGTVVNSMPAVTRKPQVELKQFDGTNFSMAMPVSFTEQPPKPGASVAPNNLESRTFVSSEMMTQILIATVSKLPSGKLEDDPSYMLRAQDTAKYKMKPIVVKNEKVVIFTVNDTQQMQQTAFWPHSGKLLTLTLSGVATDVQVTTAQFDDMIASVSWR